MYRAVCFLVVVVAFRLVGLVLLALFGYGWLVVICFS